MPHSPVASLQHRNFRLFLGGQFVSLIGTWMQTVGQGWLVLQLTNSAFKVGLVTAAGGFPVLLFTLYGGVVADRVNKRRWVAFLQTLMALEALVLALLTWTGKATPGWVAVLAAAGGLCAAFEIPARQALVAEMVGRAELMNAIALNSSVFNVTRVLGPTIAGLVIAGLGVAACFFVNAASYLAAIVALLLMHFPAASPDQAADSGGRSLGAALRYLRDNRRPRVLILLTGVFSLFGASFIAMLPVYARSALNRGAAGYGGLMSSIGVGAACAALGMAAFGARLGRHRERVVYWAGAVFGACLIVAATARNYWIAMLLLAVQGFVLISNNIVANTLLQTEVPNQLRGRLMGFYSLIVVGIAPIGAIQAGWVAEQLGVRMMMVMGGAICLIAALSAGRNSGT